jgi:hypothetical protein
MKMHRPPLQAVNVSILVGVGIVVSQAFLKVVLRATVLVIVRLVVLDIGMVTTDATNVIVVKLVLQGLHQVHLVKKQRVPVPQVVIVSILVGVGIVVSQAFLKVVLRATVMVIVRLVVKILIVIRPVVLHVQKVMKVQRGRLVALSVS